MGDVMGIVLAFLGAFGGLSGLAALWQARTAAQRSDVEHLVTTLQCLSDENARLRVRLDEVERDLEATQVLLDATRKLLEENRVQLGKYEEEVRRLRARVSELERENRCLREQGARAKPMAPPAGGGDGEGQPEAGGPDGIGADGFPLSRE